MKKGKNSNHPKSGSKIKVQPIIKIKDIKAIKKILSDNPRNLCIFILGINTNLRASDLCNLKVDHVKDLKAGDEINLIEQKTKKTRCINLNQDCITSIQNLLSDQTYKSSDNLFLSQRASKLTVPSINRLVKTWCKDINLKGNYGSHTLRKTWGYHQRVSFNASLPELMSCYNHSTQKQTLDYLCIQRKEIKNIYMNAIG